MSFPICPSPGAARARSAALLGLAFSIALCAQTVVQPGGGNSHSPIAPHTNLDLQRPVGLQETNLPGRYYDSNAALIFRRSSAVFFPPAPPVLGQKEPYHDLRIWTPAQRAGMIDLVGEQFYMPFANLLWQEQLSAKRLQRIHKYSEDAQQLALELRTKLAELKSAAPSSRAAQLAELAQRQAPRLRALEDEAEAIRTDLTTGGLFKAADTGADIHSLSRDADKTSAPLPPEYSGALETAQFHAGLSVDQRLLLHELGLERLAAVATPPGDASADAQGAVFFSPATARIRLPNDLPAPLAEKLSRFEQDKRALKDELWAAARHDDARNVAQRTARYASLAAAQAQRFAALETLAEEIRLELATLRYPDAPEAADLPADLIHRVGTAVERKTAAQRELAGRVRALRHDLPEDRVEIGRRGESLAIVVNPGDKPSRADPQTRTKILAAVAAFNDDFAARYAGLARELSALRSEIQTYAAARATGRHPSVDEIAAEFNRSYTAQETWKRFEAYRMAVLEPGLSPAQRRLLFRRALSELAKATLSNSALADAARR